MLGKVTITKEQAQELENALREYGFDEIMSKHVSDGWIRVGTRNLNFLDTEKLARACIVGYEIERTPHEKARAVYEHYRDCGESYEPSYTGIDVMEAIEDVLDALGEKVEGVNA